MAKAIKSGLLCELTVDTIAVGRSQDVSLKMTKGEAEASSRASNWKEFLPGLKDWKADIKQLCVFDEAGLLALEDSFFADADAEAPDPLPVVAVKFVDNEGDGYSGNAIVVGLERGEPLEGAVTLNVTLEGTGALAKEGTRV